MTRRPRNRSAFVILATLLCASRASAAGDSSVTLVIDIDGVAPSPPCRVSVRSGERNIEGEAPGTITVPQGEHTLIVRCTKGAEAIAIAEPLSARAAAINKNISIKTTRVRVVAKRDGALVPATVSIFGHRAPLDGTPLAQHPANNKFVVASGTYDLLIALDTKNDSDRAEARVLGLKAQGSAVKEANVDLSDGTLIATASDNGKSAEGAVRVFRDGAKVPAATGATGASLSLRPGKYSVETSLSAAADFPVRRSEVWIEPKKTVRAAEKFETGTLTVGVYRDRKPVEALVRLSLPGAEDFFNYFTAPGTVSLSPGLYDVVVAPKGEVPLDRLRRPRVGVAKGKENKIAFDLTPARLTVKVQRSGKPLELAEIEVVSAGGGAAAAKAEPDGTYLLWPGRYEIIAKLPDGAEMRDGPFELGLSEVLTRTINFARGTLTVHASRGGAVADDAEIFVYRKGAQKPVAQGRPRALLDLPPGAYDVKIVSGPETQWREDVRIKEGKTLRLDVGFAGGDAGTLPEGDLPDLPKDLPEGEPEP